MKDSPIGVNELLVMLQPLQLVPILLEHSVFMTILNIFL